jgi:hypothetical protein
MTLGVAGIVMGLGYLVNKRTQLENETPEYHEAMISREQKTGWASVGAGVGVIAAGAAVYQIVADILDQLDSIRKKLSIG